MSTLAIVLIVLGVVILLVFIGGLIAVRRREKQQAGSYAEHVMAADAELEQARALDRGWHRESMEDAVRAALRDQRPGHDYEDLHLVLVDDQPGVEEDRAHFVAVGPGGEVRVVLARSGGRWGAERVE
jgi:hypothetical protein